MYSIPPITILLLFTLVGWTKRTASKPHNTALGSSGERTSLTFNLHRECHGSNDFRYTQMDISSHQSTPTWTLQARPTTVYRPRSQTDLQRARLRSLRHSESEKVEWEAADILGPDIEDRHTLAQLARMTGNAYALPGNDDWYDIDTNWNNVRAVQSLMPPI